MGISEATEQLKPVIEGLVRGGALIKDTRRYVEWGDCREEHGPTGFALVIEMVA